MADLGPITHLTIHCAATPEGRPVTAEELCQWDTAKFGQVSYHWVVELDGSAHNTLPDTQLGAHVGMHNHGNVGVCYVGGMDADMHEPKDTRTPEQIATLLRIVHTYQASHPGIIVLGHRDWPGVTKACPSFDVASWLESEPSG